MQPFSRLIPNIVEYLDRKELARINKEIMRNVIEEQHWPSNPGKKIKIQAKKNLHIGNVNIH